MNLNWHKYRLISFRRRIIKYLLRIFTHPKVKDQIAKYAKGFIGEASRYSSGIKGKQLKPKNLSLF